MEYFSPEFLKHHLAILIFVFFHLLYFFFSPLPILFSVWTLQIFSTSPSLSCYSIRHLNKLELAISSIDFSTTQILTLDEQQSTLFSAAKVSFFEAVKVFGYWTISRCCHLNMCHFDCLWLQTSHLFDLVQLCHPCRTVSEDLAYSVSFSADLTHPNNHSSCFSGFNEEIYLLNLLIFGNSINCFFYCLISRIDWFFVFRVQSECTHHRTALARINPLHNPLYLKINSLLSYLWFPLRRSLFLFLNFLNLNSFVSFIFRFASGFPHFDFLTLEVLSLNHRCHNSIINWYFFFTLVNADFD